MRGIRFKLLIPITLAFSVLVTGMHFYWLPEMIKQVRENVIERENYVLRAISPGLVRSLLVNDLGAIHATLNYQLNINKGVWEHITFEDINGKRLFPLTNPKDKKGKYVLQIMQNVSWDNIPLGIMHLSVNWEKEYQQQLKYVHEIEFLILIVFLIYVIVTALWQNSLIILPIARLEKAATQLSNGEYNTVLPEEHKDEIGRLTRAFSSMSSDLQHSRNQHQEILMQVKESEIKHRNIVENIVNGLITVSASGKIQSINSAAEKIFGYNESELKNKDLSILLPELECVGNKENFEEIILATGKEIEGRNKNLKFFR